MVFQAWDCFYLFNGCGIDSKGVLMKSAEAIKLGSTVKYRI